MSRLLISFPLPLTRLSTALKGSTKPTGARIFKSSAILGLGLGLGVLQIQRSSYCVEASTGLRDEERGDRTQGAHESNDKGDENDKNLEKKGNVFVDCAIDWVSRLGFGGIMGVCTGEMVQICLR